MIRPMTAPDTPRVVDIHLAASPACPFLARAFFTSSTLEAVALGELVYVADDGSVLGFIMGSAAPGTLFRRLRALVKPCDAERPAGTAMIMSLGMDPSAQGRGMGRALVEAFLAKAGHRGAMRVDLTTDKVDNEVANVFYARLGFRVAREVVTPEGRVLNEPVIDL